jgi:hypothetical protein
MRASRREIMVFLLTVCTIVVIVGSLMYVIEGPRNGFTSIPASMYWAVVTLTTVGYGDVAPKTALGQTLASLVMILGYGIIAVPTGIVTAELATAGGPDLHPGLPVVRGRGARRRRPLLPPLRGTALGGPPAPADRGGRAAPAFRRRRASCVYDSTTALLPSSRLALQDPR